MCTIFAPFLFARAAKEALRIFGLLSLAILLLSQAFPALGANHLVSTSGFTFAPATISIPAGDSVTWSNLVSGFHTTTSSNGLWNSSSDGFTFVFTNAGTFHYFCETHGSLGMVGVITVTNAGSPPNVPPTVSITNPISGTVFAAPANVTVQAAPADSDGTVTNVEFLAGSTVLGSKTSAPFSVTASNLAAADYTFSAIASDNGGATATNSVTVHVINASQVRIASPAAAAANGFQFSYSTDPGLGYVVEISTDLFTWKPIATNSPAASNPALFTDPNPPNVGAFYRVGRMPNP